MPIGQIVVVVQSLRPLYQVIGLLFELILRQIDELRVIEGILLVVDLGRHELPPLFFLLLLLVEFLHPPDLIHPHLLLTLLLSLLLLVVVVLHLVG